MVILLQTVRHVFIFFEELVQPLFQVMILSNLCCYGNQTKTRNLNVLK